MTAAERAVYNKAYAAKQKTTDPFSSEAKARDVKRVGKKVNTAYAKRNQRRPEPTIINRGRGGSWPEWCVPTRHLADYINQHHEVLAADFGHIPFDIRNGLNSAANFIEGKEWRQVLVLRLQQILKMTEPGVLRRLHTVMSGKSAVTNVTFAEGCCIAVGQLIDNTPLPTLPGRTRTAKELIERRADHFGVGLPEEYIDAYARQALRLTRLIAAYPHHTERLLNLAPLDCFRPYR